MDWGLIGDGLAMDWQIVSRLATDRQRIGDGLAMDWQWIGRSAMDWQVGNGLAD